MYRVWREVFNSRSSLWSNLYCVNLEKTLAYLQRSKSSPVNLSLTRDNALYPCQIIPRVIGRLKSLSIEGIPGNVQ